MSRPRVMVETLQPLRRPSPGGEVPDPCLVVIDGPRLGQCLHIHSVPVILGRDPSADFRLPDPSVSRAHCAVWQDGDHIYVRDLHSKNGTRVNAQPLHQSTLHEGDRIEIGDVVLKFVSGRLEAQYHEALYGLATRDALTHLLNRRQFRLLLDEAVAARGEQLLAAAIIDVDHFKQVNDRLGHDAGDAVLRAIAAAIEAHLRPDDAGGRLGGDEFAVLLRGLDAAGAKQWCERLRLHVAADPNAATLSIGLSIAQRGQSAADLLRDADRHLYEAKRGGRDRVVGDT